MRDGICSKCGGGDVRQADSRFSPRSVLRLDFWGVPAIRIQNFVCLTCGYIEEYVDKADLATVAAKCPPAPGGLA